MTETWAGGNLGGGDASRALPRHSRALPRHSRTLPRHSRTPPTSFPHTPTSFPHTPTSFPRRRESAGPHLTKQNPRTTIDPWPLQRNRSPRRHLAIHNPQSPIINLQCPNSPSTKSDRIRRNAAKTRACARTLIHAHAHKASPRTRFPCPPTSFPRRRESEGGAL